MTQLSLVVLALILGCSVVQAADLPLPNVFEAQRSEHYYFETQRQQQAIARKQARQGAHAAAEACHRGLMDALVMFRQEEWACEAMGGGHGCAGPEPRCVPIY